MVYTNNFDKKQWHKENIALFKHRTKNKLFDICYSVSFNCYGKSLISGKKTEQ